METSLGTLGLGKRIQLNNSIKCVFSQLNEICAQIEHRIVLHFYYVLLVETHYNNVYNFRPFRY